MTRAKTNWDWWGLEENCGEGHSSCCQPRCPASDRSSASMCWKAASLWSCCTHTMSLVFQDPTREAVLGWTDREKIRSRINNNDCRMFRPQRPLSTAYKQFTDYTVQWLMVSLASVHTWLCISAKRHLAGSRASWWPWYSIELISARREASLP